MLWSVLPALATPPGPFLEGFAVSSRDDAPIDAWILVDANFEPAATVTSGPDAPFPLQVESVVEYGVTGDVVALLPPDGGWAPEAAYTVEVTGGDYTYVAEGLAPLPFSTGAAPADPPEEPDVSVEVGPWGPEGRYDWGCCEPTREIAFAIGNPQADAWSAVEIVAVYPDRHGPDRVGLAIGPGDHAVSDWQWKESGELFPSCWRIAGVAADGEASTPVEVCVDDRVTIDGQPQGWGCSHGGATAALATLAALSCRSSRSRSGGARRAPR